MNSLISAHFARYTGEGKFVDSTHEEAESFISLGFDMVGNEYFLLYPDILIVMGPNNEVYTF